MAAWFCTFDFELYDCFYCNMDTKVIFVLVLAFSMTCICSNAFFCNTISMVRCGVTSSQLVNLSLFCSQESEVNSGPAVTLDLQPLAHNSVEKRSPALNTKYECTGTWPWPLTCPHSAIFKLRHPHSTRDAGFRRFLIVSDYHSDVALIFPWDEKRDGIQSSQNTFWLC